MQSILIFLYEKKEIIPLTKEENKPYKEQETCYICEQKFCIGKDDENYKNSKKVKEHWHYTRKFRGAPHSKFNLNYKVPKDIPIIIHNASYDTHFIINKIAAEFKGELDCIGENTEKYISFSTPIKKKCDDGKTITYKLRFIDSLFMPTSLSELVDNMSGNSNGIECKSCTESNRCKRKRVYPYEYMDSWGKFDETSLPPKEAFYSNLNLEDVFENFRNMCLEIYKLDPVYLCLHQD